MEAGERRRETSSGGFLLVLVAIGGAALALFASTSAAHELSRVHAVGKPTRTIGFVRGMATLEAAPGNAYGACLATGSKGKNSVSWHLNHQAVVTFDDHTQAKLPDDSTVTFFRLERPRQGSANEQKAAEARARTLDRNVATWKVSCLGPHEKVWVEACLQGDVLKGCSASEGHVLLTPGGPSLREDEARARTVGFLGLALFGAALLLTGLRDLAAFQRPIVPGLSRHAGKGTGENGVFFWILLVGAPFVALVTLGLWATATGPAFHGVVLSVLMLLRIFALGRRLRVLSAARSVIAATETSRLADGEGDLSELAVRVAPDAEPVEGLDGAPHAWVQLTLHETWSEKSGNKTVQRTKEIATRSYPPTMPIEDASGRGVLDLEHCTVDVPLEPEITGETMPSVPGWAVFSAQPHERHKSWKITWRVLDPGEPLLLYGSLTRELPDVAGVAASGEGYRTPGTVPVLRGRPEHEVIAFVGSEQTVLRGVTRELAVNAVLLVVAIASLLAAAAGMALAYA